MVLGLAGHVARRAEACHSDVDSDHVPVVGSQVESTLAGQPEQAPPLAGQPGVSPSLHHRVRDGGRRNVC